MQQDGAAPGSRRPAHRSAHDTGRFLTPSRFSTWTLQNTNNGTDFDLRGLAYKYWVNPNQVLSSNGYGFNLADAESICLGSCPAVRCPAPQYAAQLTIRDHLRAPRSCFVKPVATALSRLQLMPNGNLSWVCKYPQDADGTQNVNRSRVRLARTLKTAIMALHVVLHVFGAGWGFGHLVTVLRFHIRHSLQVPNLGAWKAMNYNYFSLLNQSEVVSSCQMQVRKARCSERCQWTVPCRTFRHT